MGVCCNRPTTPRPTAPPPAYLPPATTTQSYNYPEPEEPLQFPDSNKENPFIAATVTPPPRTTQRPTTQPAPRPTTQRPLTPDEEEIAFWDFRESIPGDPETDYPILDKIPKTAFTCKGKIDGFYADEETRCQVFHVCSAIPEADPIQSSFLCPNGTIFNQESFVCQWSVRLNFSLLRKISPKCIYSAGGQMSTALPALNSSSSTPTLESFRLDRPIKVPRSRTRLSAEALPLARQDSDR